MASILKPFNILNTGALQVPTGQLVKVDWGNALSNGLIGCYLPGVMGGLDITGMGPVLTPLSAATIDSMREGPGLKSIASTSGMTGTAKPAFKSWTTQFSIYWRGYLIGNPSASCDFAGVTYDNAASDPFTVASIGVQSSPLTLTANFNAGGTFAQGGSGTFTTGAINSAGVSFTVSGSSLCQAYLNGAASGAAFAMGAAPNSSATSLVEINTYGGVTTRFSNSITTAAYFWNRALKANEFALLHNEPYSFLIPAEYEMPILQPPPLIRQRHYRFRTDAGAVDATPTWGSQEDSMVV